MAHILECSPATWKFFFYVYSVPLDVPDLEDLVVDSSPGLVLRTCDLLLLVGQVYLENRDLKRKQLCEDIVGIIKRQYMSRFAFKKNEAAGVDLDLIYFELIWFQELILFRGLPCKSLFRQFSHVPHIRNLIRKNHPDCVADEGAVISRDRRAKEIQLAKVLIQQYPFEFHRVRLYKKYTIVIEEEQEKKRSEEARRRSADTFEQIEKENFFDMLKIYTPQQVFMAIDENISLFDV